MTVTEVVDAIWANTTRTVDGLAPSASDGSYIDDVGYAVWTYVTRTVEGGSGFQITVSETMPVPVQSVDIQTVSVVTVNELLLAPSQTIVAESFAPAFEITVNESMPAPSQVVTCETQGGVVPVPTGGGIAFYPPVFPYKTRVTESAPAPTQKARVKCTKVEIPVRHAVEYTTIVIQSVIAPVQGGSVKAKRSVKAKDDEERFLMMLLSQL